MAAANLEYNEAMKKNTSQLLCQKDKPSRDADFTMMSLEQQFFNDQPRRLDFTQMDDENDGLFMSGNFGSSDEHMKATHKALSSTDLLTKASTNGG